MSRLPSDSIKEVPGRSKVRLESSNPVPRGGHLNPKTSKVKLISPEEAMTLTSGEVVSPKPELSRATSQVPRVIPPHRTPKPARNVVVSPRIKPAPTTSQVPRVIQALPTPEPSRHVLVSQKSEPPRAKLAPTTSEVPMVVPGFRTTEPSRHVLVSQEPPTSDVPTLFPAYQAPEPSRHVLVSAKSEPPRAKLARTTSEVSMVVPGFRTSTEPSRHVLVSLEPPTSDVPTLFPAYQAPEPSRHALVSAKSESPRAKPPTVEPSRHVPASPVSESPSPKPPGATPGEAMAPTTCAAAGSRREIVCSLRALSMTSTTVRQRRTNPSLLQSKMVEPPSPRALQIRSRVKQRDANYAAQAVEGKAVEDGDREKDDDSREMHLTISDEEFSELLLYRPAQSPTWKGRIVDSAMPPKFDCEFLAKPASNISKKAYRLSKQMPALLEVEMVPTGHILNMFGSTPRLSNVEIYFFSEETKTERPKDEHALLFDAMVTLNAMIKVNINGNELSIFSSKLLDKTSQFIVNTQRKTQHFLWGCFLKTKSSPDKDLDAVDTIDMDLDIDQPTLSLILKLIGRPSSSRETDNFPPGYEKIWSPPLVKLNIQEATNPLSNLSGYAGLVRYYPSGKWVFGYFRYHKSISKVAAELLAIYQGLKILWDCGFRRIRLEISSVEIIDALTTNSEMFIKRKSVLGECKDMILKEWECEIYHIAKEDNLCAEWLVKSRLDEELPQGLIFYEYPPRRLVHLLEKDRLAAEQL